MVTGGVSENSPTTEIYLHTYSDKTSTKIFILSILNELMSNINNFDIIW